MFKKMLLWGIVLSIYGSLLFSQSTTAPSLGDGSQGNPYQIASLENLYWIAEDISRWNYYYYQMNDINASETSLWNNGKGWEPIGNDDNPFTGTYNGGGYYIDSLYIDSTTQGITAQDLGLFGFADSATFRNINLRDIYVNGSIGVAGLCGRTWATLVDNCHLVGNNNTINSHMWGGGLLARCERNSIVVNCYSQCNMSAASDVGLLVGYCGGYSTIDNCWAQGNMAIDYPGGRNIGGLIGLTSPCTVRNSYSRVNIQGNATETGGLVGDNYNGIIIDCYSTGIVTGSGSIGGLTGLNNSVVIASFWDIESSAIDTSTGGTGLTSSDMKNISTFIDSSWDFEDIWDIDGITNDGYPFLRNFDYTGIINDDPIHSEVVESFHLDQNHPNPFNPATTIQFAVPEPQHVKLQIFDITGRLVTTLVDEFKEAGNWDVKWNAGNYSSGIYFYRLQYGDKHISRKMLLMK